VTRAAPSPAYHRSVPASPPDALAEAVEAALPGWVEAQVDRLVRAWAGVPPADDVRAAAVDAGRRAGAEVLPTLRELLATDVDAQRTNPLGVLRSASRYPTEVLRRAGVPPVVRDEFDERTLPDDVYGLGPLTWADLGPAVHEAGIAWGAWKAATVLARRRSEGRR
jgi:hypothetical protein